MRAGKPFALPPEAERAIGALSYAVMFLAAELRRIAPDAVARRRAQKALEYASYATRQVPAEVRVRLPEEVDRAAGDQTLEFLDFVDSGELPPLEQPSTSIWDDEPEQSER